MCNEISSATCDVRGHQWDLWKLDFQGHAAKRFLSALDYRSFESGREFDEHNVAAKEPPLSSENHDSRRFADSLERDYELSISI
jgi:hypothetical protein